jgi:hypothetical protein
MFGFCNIRHLGISIARFVALTEYSSLLACDIMLIGFGRSCCFHVYCSPEEFLSCLVSLMSEILLLFSVSFLCLHVVVVVVVLLLLLLCCVFCVVVLLLLLNILVYYGFTNVQNIAFTVEYFVFLTSKLWLCLFICFPQSSHIIFIIIIIIIIVPHN